VPLPPIDLERCVQCGTPLRVSVSAPGCLQCLLTGGLEKIERQFQHYQVELCADGTTLRELGRGAMGVTYRAVDQNLGAAVALKAISARYSNQAEARERFRREARAAAQLRHPNVASVFHYGETPGGHCFYAMELVEGETLEARVRREGSLGVEVVLAIGAQVARALIAAEKQGLVHRDLKPSNLMLVPNDQDESGAPLVKVIDFGLARAINGEGAETSLTQSSLSGTPGFASPEQLQENGQKLDTRSDIYSLGATLWYALTGDVPYQGRTISEIQWSQQTFPLSITQLTARKIPRPLIEILRRALALDPKERPASAQALLAQLESCRIKLAPAPRQKIAVLMGTGIALMLISLGLLLSRGKTPARINNDKSIAVLPFQNLSDEKANAYFATGVQDEILSDLARIADLKVISRTSVMRYEGGAGRDLRQIGATLGAANIVEGSVQRAGQRIRVVVQLIDARTDSHLWGETYDRDLSDIFAVQDQIAQQIASQLQAKNCP
jgi:serine/threonine protein kinase